MCVPSLHSILFGGVLACATLANCTPSLLARSCDDPLVLRSFIGQVARKCCKPGRRWGCDPRNFNQTGCVHIEKQYPNCYAGSWSLMRCTSASCESAGSEDVCNVAIRTVGLNRCRPLGTKTTVGCPPDHWQCNVEMLKYYASDAPTSDVFVCDIATSTICSFNYSACD